MKHLYFLLIAGLILFMGGCGEESSDKDNNKDTTKAKVDELREKAKKFFAVLPEKAESKDNVITEEKVKLGKTLYHDTRLSKEGNQSCNTCHDLNKFGVDNLSTSPGDAGKNGTRNSPTVLNAALNVVQFWDGRELNVEAQAGGPVLNPVEMNIPSEEFMVKRLSEVEAYVKMFKEAFPESEVITYENMRKAIAAFERTLLTPSKFDKYLAGEDVFSDDEKKGLETFINAGCHACHNQALLGGNTFQKFAYNENDKGRFDVTKNEADMYMFKTQSLRNVAMTYPYFHDGGVEKLEDAVKIMAKENIEKELTDAEVSEIVIFLNTLTGEIPAEALETPAIP